MARFKAKAYDGEGKEVEVELDDAQFIAVDQHKLRVNRTVQDRLAKQAVNIRSELLEDEGFRKEVLAKAGVDPDKKGGSDKSVDEASIVERVQKELRDREVKPLQEKLTGMEQSVAKGRHKQLVSSLTAELIEAGVKKSVAARIAEIEAGRFGYDEKTDSFAVKTAEGFEFSSNASQDAPYKGTKEFATGWAGDKLNADFVDRQKQGGPGMGSAQATAGNVRSKADFKNDLEKARWMAENGTEAFLGLPEK